MMMVVGSRGRARDLFDKFLYVGATRAATFLGLTASGALPSMLAQMTLGLPNHWDLHI